LDLGTGSTLSEIDGILYAAFPKVRGRTLDELDDERLRQIGRLIGRMHAVGAARDAAHRPRLTVERYVHEPLDVLLSGGVLREPMAGRYRDLALRIADAVAKPLARARAQRIHGDLHWGNVVWGADGPILLDFDDCLVGPPVQDLWLLSLGDSEQARRGRAQLLEGYEIFREFDRSTLAVCEPLRALRIIYMSAWIARRWDDASFRSGFPAFGTDGYWAAEYEALFNIFESLAGQT
jgi:Ser/Thr protein kinase RdoA (MazF antagonist)